MEFPMTPSASTEPVGQRSDSSAGSFTFATAWGWTAFCWSAGRVHRLVFGHATPQAALGALWPEEDIELVIDEPTGAAAQLADRLRAYLDGEPDDFRDVPVALAANTPFQRSVLQACRRIPYGQTRTYGQLAATAGSPRACRAVGNIMAANRLPLIIPCHRVVGSHGSLGGYSAPGGLTLKRRLLQLEGARHEA
jgi:methylated-DNA-[protein]-cysteine S-methyltransferase